MTGRGFQYVYRVVMSYFLTLKEFGILSASLPYQSFVLLFTSMSITPTASKFTSQYKVEDKEKIGNVFSLLVLGVLIGGVLYGSTGVMSSFFGPEFSASQPLLKILSVTLPFAVFFCICTGIFLGYEKAELTAFSLLVYQCTMVVSSYILVQYTGLTGAAQGIFCGYVLSGVVAGVIVVKFGISAKVILKEMVRILRFVLPVLTGVVGLWGLLNVDILILARFASTEQVGLYGMAAPTARLIFGFSAAVSALLIPKVSELQHRGIDATQSIARSFEVCTMVTVPIAVTLAAFSKEVLYVLFGTPDGYPGLVILSVGMLFYSLFFVGYSALQGLGHPVYAMGSGLFAFVCNICLCFLLIPRFGLGGAALATSISCGLGMGVTIFMLNVFVVPRIHYSIVLLPLFFLEYVIGVFQSRITTLAVYAAFGLPFIGIYFYLSRKYLYSKNSEPQ